MFNDSELRRIEDTIERIEIDLQGLNKEDEQTRKRAEDRMESLRRDMERDMERTRRQRQDKERELQRLRQDRTKRQEELQRDFNKGGK